MNEISAQEAALRVAGIDDGPWTAGLQAALAALARPASKRPAPAGPPDLATPLLAPGERKKNKALQRTLRIHFEAGGGGEHGDPAVEDPEEIEVRAAVDQALLYLDLLELAVDTGYLPLAFVEERARTLIGSLLWSPAARNYLSRYNHPAVERLALRVGISGLSRAAIDMPTSREPEVLRFAGFLAHLRTFHGEGPIKLWTEFLDDFIVENFEQRKVWAYLTVAGRKPPKRIEALLNGAFAFVAALADVFADMNPSQRVRFGLLHAYWLQLFFGQRATPAGYERDLGYWLWADGLASFVERAGASPSSEETEAFQRSFRAQVAVLRDTFGDIARFVTLSRRTAATDPRS